MNDIDDLRLGIALRDRLEPEHPNLEHLAAAALADGRRMQRRRRLFTAGGAAAAVTGITALTFGLGMIGGNGGTHEVQASDWAASSPSAEPTPSLHDGQTLDLGDGVTGTITRDSAGLIQVAENTRPGPGTGFTVVPHGTVKHLNAWYRTNVAVLADWPGIKLAFTAADAQAMGLLGKVDKAPVTAPAGWTCEWYLIDDKAACTSADGGVAGLVIRDADEHTEWVTSPDKGNTPSIYVTDVHQGIFISVQAGQGTTNAEVRELGEGLTWK